MKKLNALILLVVPLLLILATNLVVGCKSTPQQEAANLTPSVIDPKIVAKSDGEFSCKYFGNVTLKNLDTRFRKLCYGKEFDQILIDADLAITASGTTVWDLLARKIPFGIACVASNQIGNFNYVVKNSLAAPIGKINNKNDF